jgi:hypothetical protein
VSVWAEDIAACAKRVSRAPEKRQSKELMERIEKISAGLARSEMTVFAGKPAR